MKSTPISNLRHGISFFTLAGVSSAELRGSEIVGTQQSPLPEVRGPENAVLCAEFANWPNDAEGVLRFTQRYGALRAPLIPGAKFSFQISDWQKDQALIRSSWEMTRYIAQKFGLLKYGNFRQAAVRIEEGEEFIIRERGLEYRTGSLFRLLWMELISIPIVRLRKCLQLDCQTPFFVATHLGQKYCSKQCAHRAQREWKRDWWRERGADWRREKRKETRKRSKSQGKSGGRR
jgi:hypothetical protein